MTFGGTLVTVDVPWELRFALRTECVNLVVVSFGVEIVSVAVIHNLWGT
jgi:hypothetical protein